MVKLYGTYRISGMDFGTINNVTNRLAFSPDDIHSVNIQNMADNCLLITNNANIDFEFTITRGMVPMAIVKYSYQNGIIVNKQWRIVESEMMNRELDFEPIKEASKYLNFEIGTIGNGRFDIKFDKKDFVALFFDHRKLYMCRYNGDYAMNHFEEFVERECDRRPLDIVRVKQYLDCRHEVKLRIVRDYITSWLQSNNAGEEFNSDAIIRRFLAAMDLDHSIELINKTEDFLFR